jgi:hypothetical protein
MSVFAPDLRRVLFSTGKPALRHVSRTRTLISERLAMLWRIVPARKEQARGRGACHHRFVPAFGAAQLRLLIFSPKSTKLDEAKLKSQLTLAGWLLCDRGEPW